MQGSQQNKDRHTRKTETRPKKTTDQEKNMSVRTATTFQALSINLTFRQI